MTRSTNRSTKGLTDRSASERVFTNHCSIKTGKELKQLMHQPDPLIDVRRSSIVSLKSWAEARQHEDWCSMEGRDADLKNYFWLGYIRAICDILEMEAS
jgi:hypothetical protein